MDYEEKYKEALERAKELVGKWIGKNKDFYIEDYSYIFPELKESEDEKIRKGLIQHLQELRKSHVNLMTKDTYDSWISWLEKQCEQKLLNNDKYQTVPVKILDRLYESEKELERLKQGEQKPINKVEPKFRVGDWIIKNDDSSIHIDYSCCKITKVENGNYTIESIYGYKGYNTFETFEKDYHLWTIQDAKDGDILAIDWVEGNVEWQKIVLFISLIDNGVEGFGTTFKNNKPVFGEGVLYSMTWTNRLHPATKEQRDTLMKAIADAGYEWDADKKVLKKIK